MEAFSTESPTNIHGAAGPEPRASVAYSFGRAFGFTSVVELAIRGSRSLHSPSNPGVRCICQLSEKDKEIHQLSCFVIILLCVLWYPVPQSKILPTQLGF